MSRKAPTPPPSRGPLTNGRGVNPPPTTSKSKPAPPPPPPPKK